MLSRNADRYVQCLYGNKNILHRAEMLGETYEEFRHRYVFRGEFLVYKFSIVKE